MDNEQIPGKGKIFRITIKSIHGGFLFFHTPSYHVIDSVIKFYDTKTRTTKRFAVSNCEIDEVKDRDQK